jgi:asparagine synthase (glutamine-hydrolysing)
LSGIVGTFHRDGAAVDRLLLQALTEYLSYRGPDATRTWSDGPIGLGHTLLRTTPETGLQEQPANLDKRLWIVADARLDDRTQLIEQLKSAGCAPRACAPDGELILDSYGVWAENCVDHLRGDFSFAIWDGCEKILFCARDHFGIKPFYYAQLQSLFLFSNTLNGVRAHPHVSDKLNDSAIADFLLFGLNYDEATTSFRDVHRLPPAHCLTVKRDTLRLRHYWTPPANGRIRYRHDHEYVEHFQTLLQAAVKDRAQTDRVGILLSGGLDSTSLAATAKELSSRSGGSLDIRTYTALYESLIPDPEADYASNVAEFLRLPRRRLAMDHSLPFVWSDDPGHTFPEPPDNPFFAALFDQFRVVAEDCRVLFSGEGNDNLMYFQMWPYIQSLRRNGDWKRLMSEVPQYLWVRPFPWRGIEARLKGFFASNSGDAAFPPWIAPDFARRLCLQERSKECSNLRMPLGSHPVRPKAHASLTLPHWTSMFENENAGVTQYPVEVRYPFLDLRIVEYLLALPPFPCFFQKTLLRKAMAGKLPESVRLRPKTPFEGNPLSAHFRRDGIAWVNQTLLNPELDQYINRAALLELHGNMDAEQMILGTRPHCLNFWLQSVRSPQSKMRVETGNG